MSAEQLEAQAVALRAVRAAADAATAAEIQLREAVRAARATGATVDAIAEEARIGRATLYRWLKGSDPDGALPPRDQWVDVMHAALRVALEHVVGDHPYGWQGLSTREPDPIARRLASTVKAMSGQPGPGSADWHTLAAGTEVMGVVLNRHRRHR